MKNKQHHWSQPVINRPDCWGSPIIHHLCYSHDLAKALLKEGKTGSGKKSDMESHLLIIVPGEWKTEFPLWFNYSLVSLMKPTQASFQRLDDVSEAWLPRVLSS
jgi:hypothetical protein